jgi:signal transduction histidine kinase/phage shock protein PspC (stress-responsive transcriptional regulator)
MSQLRGPCDHRRVTTSPPRPPLERGGDGALVAGVASGLARHLRVEPVKVRLAFVVLTAVSGAGILLYAGFWAVIPRSVGAPRTRLTDRGQFPAMVALALGGLLLATEIGWSPLGSGLWPVLVLGAGVAVVWRQADEASWARWFGVQQHSRGRWLRVAGGIVLLVAGMIGFLASNHELRAARDGVVAIVVVVAGLALVLAPWWWSLVQDLGAERRERIRSQERSELAAHLHDSVLQTLALIQRRADSPNEVQRLARSQERELRAWLYARREEMGVEGTFAGAVEAVAAEVEERHGMPVEVVTVGDCPLDERTDAVVRAAREAMVNAAKFAHVGHVDVFAEVTTGDITVFVRDTGGGFDVDAVPADRQGIAGSIVGRMARHGGTAVVRSAPGEGTEVELRLSRVVS